MLNLLIQDGRFKFDKPLNYGTYPLELLVHRNQPEAVKLILPMFQKFHVIITIVLKRLHILVILKLFIFC